MHWFTELIRLLCSTYSPCVHMMVSLLSLLTNLSGSAGIRDPDPAVRLLLHDNSASRTSVISTLNTLFFHVPRVKVAEHSFGSLWVHVICQIMAIERLQLTNETWQVKNILMKGFDWQVKCDVFLVSMETWTIEYSLKISVSLSLHKILPLDFPINLHTAYCNG